MAPALSYYLLALTLHLSCLAAAAAGTDTSDLPSQDLSYQFADPSWPPPSLVHHVYTDLTRHAFFVLAPQKGEVVPDMLEGLPECQYFGFQYSMEVEFLDTLAVNRHFTATDWRFAKYIVLSHCASFVYFHLKDQFQLDHWTAIERTETYYLVPLVRWARRHPAHQRHDGRNFVIVYSMDLGRFDFPMTNQLTQAWSVGGLPGSQFWLNTTGLHGPKDWVSAVAGSLPQNSCFEEDTLSVTVTLERDFKPWDFVIAIPSRFNPHPNAYNTNERTRLLFFAGSLNSGARRLVYELYGSDRNSSNTAPNHVYVSKTVAGSDEYESLMWTTKYCLVLRGSSHTNNVRLYDVMVHGCVPVIVSDDFQGPLDNFVNWRDSAVFLPTSDIPNLVPILESIPAWRYQLMHFNIVKAPYGAMRAFEWQSGTFWMFMFGTIAQTIDTHLQSSPYQVAQAATAHTLHRSFMDFFAWHLGWTGPDDITHEYLGSLTVASHMYGCEDTESLIPLFLMIQRRIATRQLRTKDQPDSRALDYEPLIIVDAGANIGKTSALLMSHFGDIPFRRFVLEKGESVLPFIVCPREFSRARPNVFVVSVEPNARNWEQLIALGSREQWAQLEGWLPVQACVGGYDGVARFQTNADLPVDEVSLLIESDAEVTNSSAITSVPVYTLQTLLDDHIYPFVKDQIAGNATKNITPDDQRIIFDKDYEVFLLKLDIEGQEPRALVGARDLLTTGRVKFIVMEYSSSVWKASLLETVGRYMYAVGYMCFLITFERLVPMGGPFWHDVFNRLVWSNVFCGKVTDEDTLEMYVLYNQMKSREPFRDAYVDFVESFNV